MNIFYLHEEPTRAANVLWETNPKRGRKMIVETAQILSTVCTNALYQGKLVKPSMRRARDSMLACFDQHGRDIIKPAFLSHPIMLHDYTNESLEWLLLHGATLLRRHDLAADPLNEEQFASYDKPRRLYGAMLDIIADMNNEHCHRKSWQEALRFPDCARNANYGIISQQQECATPFAYRRYLWLRENFTLLFPACRSIVRRTNSVHYTLDTVADQTRFDWLLQPLTMPVTGERIREIIKCNTNWFNTSL